MSLSFATKAIQVNGVPHSILLQGDNGPCALLALANTLLLAPQYAAEARELVNLVQRGPVKLEDLVQVLANIAIMSPNGANTDVNQLFQVLPQLHTGLNVNPIFNGTFEDGVEMAVFRLYNVGIVHGWIIDSDNDPIARDHVSKYSYEGAQKVLLQFYDIQNGSSNPPNAEMILEDANYIRAFLARSATQLTDYGLVHLKELLVEKSFAVLFRNDHFSTIYKYDGELFTLVTDLGFKDRSDIVWQSLKSVNGSADLFYTGNFIPAMQATPGMTVPVNGGATTAPTKRSTNPFLDDSDSEVSSQDPVSQQRQYEDDEALAMRLQEEEDSAAADNMQRGYRRRENKKPVSSTEGNEGKARKRDKIKKSCIIM
ncbi:YGL082W and YPL191C [Zygosaccharomyces parabailii]|nr:YGL082W and YPL191C [Zygosaccharomyces parabailii]